jgi:hypothetical protein
MVDLTPDSVFVPVANSGRPAFVPVDNDRRNALELG